MNLSRFVSVAAVLWLSLLSSYAKGQTGAGDAEGQKVSVPFFANDGRDSPATTVSPADVTVLDGNKAAKLIVGVTGRTELPLRLGVVIDTSNSQRTSGLYQPAVQAATDFLNQVLTNPQDKIFVEKFDVLPDATQFMNKHQLSESKIDLSPAGATALYDAINLACDQRMKNDPVKDALRVVVLLSDGEDDQSHSTLKDAIASAQRARVVIFAVSTKDDSAPFAGHGGRGNETLKHFADETGGVVFLHLNKKNLSKVFTDIKDQIDNMHLLSYVPSDPGHNGQYRSVELKTT
jgi:VWFA-related protein